jgi:hypothetical protein
VDVSPGARVQAGDPVIHLQGAPEALVAPVAGVVGDVRARAGQRVAPGEALLHVVDGGGGYELIALLPGASASHLKRGLPLTLRLPGHLELSDAAVVDHVDASVVSPDEAARLLGREDERTPLSGPMVLVRSALPAPQRGSGAHALTYQDGMVGEAQVTIRSQRMIVILVPGLGRLLEAIG